VGRAEEKVLSVAFLSGPFAELCRSGDWEQDLGSDPANGTTILMGSAKPRGKLNNENKPRIRT
jgi:hypothetical protein